MARAGVPQRITRAAGVLAAVLLFGNATPGPLTVAHAQSQPLATGAQVDISSQDVEHFLESWALITDAIEQRDSEFDSGDMAGMLDQLAAMQSVAATSAALNEIVAEYGFTDLEDWITKTYSIFIARMWLEEPPDQQEFEEARKAITELEGMTDEQKQEMIASLEEALGVVAASEPSAANKAAVEPYLEEIAAVLDGSE